MTEELERRWDDAVETAWSEFRQRLGDRLAAMADGETLVVELPRDDEMTGAAPYCQALNDAGVLRVEAVSNAFLGDARELDPVQEATLEVLGFDEPQESRSPNWWVHLEQREADHVAVMMVRALREVYGVLHPVYLHAGGLEPQPVAPSSTPASDDDPTVFPQDSDELRVAVHQAVEVMLGQEPEWDEDGDLPLFTERAAVYVTLAPKAPRVLVFSHLVVDVVDLDRALVEVNILNRNEFGLTFVLSEGRISVRRELPLTAFVPGDFRMELQRLADRVDGWVSELIERVGGRGWLDDGPVSRPPGSSEPETTSEQEPEDGRFARALKVLRELEREQRDSVDPTTMLRIFHGDRDLLMLAIRTSTSRAATWGKRMRKAEAEGKVTWARACKARQRYHEGLRRRQRRALRMAVQTSARRERQEQLALFSEDEAAGT